MVSNRAAAPLVAAGVTALVGLKLLADRLGCSWAQLNYWTKRWGGLESVVSFSSRLIAAARALEDEEEEHHRLVHDPLARVLAGPEAIANAKRRTQPAPQDSGRRHKINMMAIRTKWFDDQLEAALGMPVEAAAPESLQDPEQPAGSGPYIWTPPPGAHKPHQVVMLGAGMDARPWRMKLPVELKWFEVDRPDVLEAKQTALADAGAEVPREHPRDEGPGGLLRTTSLDKVEFPLRTGDWAAVATDLASPAWLDDLLAAGFDPAKPTVWVAEGLLMYLDPATVDAVLRAAAGVSAPGSVLLAVTVSEQVIHDLRDKGARSELMESWKFGVPGDPEDFFSTKGWDLQLSTTRRRMAAALRLRRDLRTFAVGEDHERTAGSLFLVAVVQEAK